MFFRANAQKKQKKTKSTKTPPKNKKKHNNNKKQQKIALTHEIKPLASKKTFPIPAQTE